MTRMICCLNTLIVGLIIAGLAATGPVRAKTGNPYSPRIIVNDRAVTNWELEQRVLFLQLLDSPGDLEKSALKGLIDDRLRMDAARNMGITPSDAEITKGMTEFAGRANLTSDAFIAEIAKTGVAAQTFRDFVRAGIAWRQVIQGRFGPRAQITEAEIDRALALSTQKGGARVLLSELILRADTPAYKDESRKLVTQLSASIKTPGAFAAAAQRYSVSNSATRGGRIDWLDLANLPPAIATQVLSLGPGDVTEPIPVPNAIALFQLRAIKETDVPEPATLAIDYARYFVPRGGIGAAEKVRARVDSCDDLYGVAKRDPETALLRETRQVAEIPGDLALELAKLDPGESTVLTRGDSVSVLMLCARTPDPGATADRGEVRKRLVNQRLASYADGYLAELKANAIIRTP